MSQSERTDVFTEVPAEGPTPKGFVDLVIKASIKTRLGKPAYSFLANIDGQAGLWKVDGQKETVPLYDQKGRVSHDPDAGEGTKHLLEKKVRLAAGPHTIFFGLPEESYYAKVELTLKEDGPSVLEFKPRYRYKKTPTRIPAFLKGISIYETLLNGQIVRRE